ncbi:MAG TPA: FHA domain-containing protein [Steroidobacteraceae bacterium]|nr:FHA domain-containing protein [Steroidobacteraceae bacterium]
MKFKLIKVAGGAEFDVTRTMVAGRSADCEIKLTQGLPSRRHGQVSVAGSVVWVEDLGSANGTFVNGVKIETKTQLRSGDLVRFDVEEFRFHVDGEVADNAGAPTLYRAPPPKQTAAPETQLQSQTPPLSAETKPEPKQEPKPEQIAESSGIFKRPGAWADPDSDDGANKTKFMDSAALKAMLDHAPKADTTPQTGRVDSPGLTILSGTRSGTRIKLQATRGQSAEWSIGSGAECEVQLSEDGVSALHAKLINDGQRWKLVDQMSANGSYVNGKRSTMVYLSAGDRIAIGPVECEFQLPASMQQATTSAAPADQKKSKLPLILALVVLLLIAAAAWFWWRA